MEDFDYVSSLPQTPVEPTNLPKPVDFDKVKESFKTTLPQYTRVNENVPLTETETLDQIADKLNNTPTGVNYTPNILAPIEVGVDTSRYKDVDISLAQLQSGKLEQYAAQSQSYWDRLWNDTKVTGANLGIGFATAFTSIYDMINDGSFIPSEHSITSKLGTISSDFAEKNTNFQTQYDIDNPIKSLLLPAFLTGSSKGWGEIAKSASIGVGTGAGILVQELGITALTGGTGSIPLLAANIRNLIRSSSIISKAAETANTLRAGTTALETGIAAVETTNAAIQAGNITKNIINFGKNTVRGALSAYGESAFEAQESRDNFTLEKIKEFKDKNGYLPTGADLDKIKNVAEQAHDARFLLNFGLLTFSNMPFLNGIFKQFDDVMSVSEQAASKGLKYTGRAGDGFEKAFQLKSDWWTKNAVNKAMKTAIETGQPYLKNIATGKSITWSEGLEEGYQYWVDKATNNYYNTIYNQGTNDIIDGTLTDTVYGLANSFYKTKDQLLSTEGLQNIIGGILGGTGQSIVAKGVDVAKNGFEDKFKEGSQFRLENTQQIQQGVQDIIGLNSKEFQDAINIDSITGDLKSKVESLRGAYSGVGLMQETNSVITFNKLKDITKWHTIAPLVMRGQIDIVKEQLTSTLSDISDEQFKLMTGVQEVTPATRSKYVSEVLNDIDRVDKSVRKNLSTFRNKYKKGTDEYNLYEDAKKIFAFHGYLSEGMIADKKKLEAENSILFNAPNIASALDLVVNGKGKNNLLNTIDTQIKAINANIDILKPIVKEGEIQEISEQNKQLIKESEEQKKKLEDLKESVNTFEGKNRAEVAQFLLQNLDVFQQTDLVLNNENLSAENQLENILEQYTNHSILSNNLAEHLDTYNNLVKSYKNVDELKDTLGKYKNQALVNQSSFKDLEAVKGYNYFSEKVNEVELPLDSDYIKTIKEEFNKLQKQKASYDEYKEVVDKNIEQFLKEKPEEVETPDVEDVEVTETDNVDRGEQKEIDELKTLKSQIKGKLTKEQIEEAKTVLAQYKTVEDPVAQKLYEEIEKILENKVPFISVAVTSEILAGESEVKNKLTDEIKKQKIKELQQERKKALEAAEVITTEKGRELYRNEVKEKYAKLIYNVQNDITESEIIKKDNKEDVVDTGSINSKTVESIVYIDDDGKIISLKSEEGKQVGIQNAKTVSNTLQLGKELDVDTLDFKVVTSNEDITTPLKWDKVFKRTSSKVAIQVVDNNNNFITLIQTPETLLLNTDLIIKLTDTLTKKEKDLLSKNKDISVVEALKQNILTPLLFSKLKEVKTKTEGKTHSILVVNEDYNTFKETILKQAENFEKLVKVSDIKSEFKKLYSGFESYANGMNEVKSKVVFTKDLPFNFIGEWNQPIFTIESIGAIALNGRELEEKRDEFIVKINEALKELKEKTPIYHEILLNSGSYFTVFSDQNGKAWIKPISLKLDNSTEKIEEQLFQNEEVTEETQNEIKDKYIITAYDKKENGESIRIRLYENNKKVNIAFNKKVNGETISYYLDNVNQKDLGNILNGKLDKKPKLKKDQEQFAKENNLPLELDVFNLSIIKNSSKDDRLELITNGSYFVNDIDNSTSIFQNVGFRLKFKEQKENIFVEVTTSPSIITNVTEKNIKENTKIINEIKSKKAKIEKNRQIDISVLINKRKQNYDITSETFEKELGEINTKYDVELKALEQSEQKQEQLKSPVEEFADISRKEIEGVKKEKPIVKQDSLQEISYYVWNNLSYEEPGKGFTVFELKENIDISELNSKFVQYKEAEVSKDPKIRKNKSNIKKELLEFFNKKEKVQDYSKKGELPSQRAFLEDNTEIVNQFVINCK